MTKLYLFISLFVAFASYSASVYTVGTETKQSPAPESAAAGKAVFQKYNCISCHQLYGLGGYLGPDLTTTISDKSRGEVYARALLKSGSERMPDFHLSQPEVNNLIAYLHYVDETAALPLAATKEN